MARKPFTATKEQRTMVAIMAACGMPQDLIRERILSPYTGNPITKATLAKVFREELDNGLQSANAMVAQSLFKKATGQGRESVTAAIFWLKTRAGWKDRPEYPRPGEQGDSTATDPGDDLLKDPAEVAKLLAEIGRRAAARPEPGTDGDAPA